MTDSIRKAFEDSGLIPEVNSRPEPSENENENAEQPGDGIREAFARAGLLLDSDG